jgi:hypothetical protein
MKIGVDGREISCADEHTLAGVASVGGPAGR